jgi:transposase
LGVGGEGGSRLWQRMGLRASQTGILRLLRQQVVAALHRPRVLGVDDWALRKGERYGTILVDLERHQPVDLLPDREAETFATWLKAHPGVEIISRDRGSQYIEGATIGAPTALQVADRWHLLHNLREAVQEALEPHRAALTVTVESPAAMATATPSTPKKKAWAYHRQERLARYEKMVALAEQGLDNQAIAQAVGVSVTTVRHDLAAGQFPEWQPRPVVSKWLAPYVPYLQQRWAEGCHHSAQ